MTGFVLSLLLNLLLISAVLAFVIVGIGVLLNTDRGFERMLRIGMALCGALVVLGANAGGITIAEYTANTLDKGGVIAFTLFTVLPATMGGVLGWYISNAFPRSSDIAIRVMAFVGTMAATGYLEVYGAAIKSSGFSLGPAVIPNVAFVIGVIVYVALTHQGRRRTGRVPISARR
jgi:hypothetical protein